MSRDVLKRVLIPCLSTLIPVWIFSERHDFYTQSYHVDFLLSHLHKQPTKPNELHWLQIKLLHASHLSISLSSHRPVHLSASYTSLSVPTACPVDLTNYVTDTHLLTPHNRTHISHSQLTNSPSISLPCFKLASALTTTVSFMSSSCLLLRALRLTLPHSLSLSFTQSN